MSLIEHHIFWTKNSGEPYMMQGQLHSELLRVLYGLRFAECNVQRRAVLDRMHCWLNLNRHVAAGHASSSAIQQ